MTFSFKNTYKPSFWVDSARRQTLGHLGLSDDRPHLLSKELGIRFVRGFVNDDVLEFVADCENAPFLVACLEGHVALLLLGDLKPTQPKVAGVEFRGS